MGSGKILVTEKNGRAVSQSVRFPVKMVGEVCNLAGILTGEGCCLLLGKANPDYSRIPLPHPIIRLCVHCMSATIKGTSYRFNRGTST